VRRIQHPQQIEGADLIGLGPPVVEGSEHPFRKAATLLGRTRSKSIAVTANLADQGRDLADNPQLAPLAAA